MKSDILHPVVLGHCVSAIRDIMKKNNYDVNQAFDIFKKEDYIKTRALSKLNEEKFEYYQEEIKKAVIDYEITGEVKKDLSWFAVGSCAKKVASIMIQEKKSYEEAFEEFSNSQFTDMFKIYTVINLKNSRERIKSKVNDLLPAGFSLNDAKDVQYAKGGKKRLILIDLLDEIDLSDAHIVLKNLRDIISLKYGRSEDKIKISQMNNDSASKRLPKNSFSLIISFMNLDSRDKFVISEEFQLLFGAILATAIRYNSKEALSIFVP